MSRIACLVIMSLIVSLVLLGTGCGGTEKGALPALQTGDRWVAWASSGETESTITLEVTGDVIVSGKDCYVVEGAAEPPYMGIISALTMAYDKATFFPVAVQSSGQFMALPYEVLVEYSYEFGGDPLFPLKVGGENEVVEMLTSTRTIMGETSTESETSVYTNRVEKIEEVTVPAGTFECFKIVEYDEDGNPTSTSWYSDEVRWPVREEDYELGEVVRLVQYSLK